MVVFDTSTILLAIDPRAKPPLDPVTNAPVVKCKERVEHLLKTLQASKTQILIPTPVLAEYLVGAGPNKGEYVEKIVSSKNFEVASFNIKAAIELSMLADPDLNAAKKLDDKTTWAKLKYDRQIIAIAKSLGAVCVYTDDKNLAACAQNNGIAATLTWEIPLPPEPPQLDLGLEAPRDGQ